MAAVAVIVDDMFEDSEYTEPVKAFIAAGHTVRNIGIAAGRTVTGKKDKIPVVLDLNVQKARVADFDALLIPGGYSPDKLRAHPAAVAFAGDFLRSGKPVFAICHAPQLLITADVLRGRRITGYRSVVQDIKNAGAEYVDMAVVVDDNLVTSRQPEDLPMFIAAAMDMLHARRHAASPP